MAPDAPAFPDFKEIELADKALFDKYFMRDPPAISEYTFCNLYVWRESHPLKWCVLDSALCIVREDGRGVL